MRHRCRQRIRSDYVLCDARPTYTPHHRAKGRRRATAIPLPARQTTAATPAAMLARNGRSMSGTPRRQRASSRLRRRGSWAPSLDPARCRRAGGRGVRVDWAPRAARRARRRHRRATQHAPRRRRWGDDAVRPGEALDEGAPPPGLVPRALDDGHVVGAHAAAPVSRSILIDHGGAARSRASATGTQSQALIGALPTYGELLALGEGRGAGTTSSSRRLSDDRRRRRGCHRENSRLDRRDVGIWARSVSDRLLGRGGSHFREPARPDRPTGGADAGGGANRGSSR